MAVTITIDMSAWKADGTGPGGHGPNLHGGDFHGVCPPKKPNADQTKAAPGQTKTPDDKGKDHKITICHVPPGNPDNAHTITIDESAWKADGSGSGGHGPGLHGGDSLGACPNEHPTMTPGGPTSTPEATGHKIVICHVPPGNPANAHRINIDESAWKADGSGKGGHGPGLHGGDSLGACPNVPTATPTNTPTLDPSITPTLP
jgi:hypothetical protein